MKVSELEVKHPNFGNHKWLDLRFNNFPIEGCAGNGPIGTLICEECGYKVIIRFGYKVSSEKIVLKIVQHYDEPETCKRHIMKRALE